MHKTAIVVGAGIVGLATARALAARKYEVKIFERNARATGASIRNFGMVWPIGQPDGKLYERAMLSAGIWKQICNEANIWHDEVGSLHLAYNEFEWKVLCELAEVYSDRQYRLLLPDEVAQHSCRNCKRKFGWRIIQFSGNYCRSQGSHKKNSVVPAGEI